jgi:CDP-diacylglycerol--glycerol-3-phosphate 3-phosphatidyltransferase
MTLADKVTSIRLILAPAFFVIYLLPQFFSFNFIPLWTVSALWLLFVASEVTDLLDGFIARKRGEVSDFGKFYDPFADTLTQITYFFCFVLDGILPPLLFLAVLYREFSILFIRNLMLKKGITLGARMGGKIKTVTYIAAAALALMASSVVRLDLGGNIYQWLVMAAKGVFVLSVIIAVVSFFDYLLLFIKKTEKK